MNQGDILQMAFASLFLGLFISGLITIASGGTILITDQQKGMATFNEISSMFSTRSASLTFSSFLDQNIINKTSNPLAFDIILGIANIAMLLFKMLDFLITALVNFLTLGLWLTSSGVPGAITGMIVMGWQFWQFYYLGKFFFRDRLVGS